MRDRLLDVRFEALGDSAVVAAVGGEIDSSNAADLRIAVSDQLPASAATLILDLSEVSYLDSSGVEAVFAVARRLSERRQGLRVVAAHGTGVRRVLELCAVSGVAELHATRAEAGHDL